MAASFWGGGSVPPPMEVVVTGNSPDLWHTLASPSLCIHDCQTPAGSQGSALPRLRLCWICGRRSPLGVWFQCFGSKSLTAVSMHRAILPCSCLCGGSIPAVVLHEPGWLLWLGSTFGIPPQGAAGTCATVTRAARSEFVSCKQDVSQCCRSVFYSDRHNCT